MRSRRRILECTASLSSWKTLLPPTNSQLMFAALPRAQCSDQQRRNLARARSHHWGERHRGIGVDHSDERRERIALDYGPAPHAEEESQRHDHHDHFRSGLSIVRPKPFSTPGFNHFVSSFAKQTCRFWNWPRPMCKRSSVARGRRPIQLRCHGLITSPKSCSSSAIQTRLAARFWSSA